MRRRINGVEASSSGPAFSGTLLERNCASSTPLSSIQGQSDSLVTQFVHEATDPTILASFCAGGVAYRMGRIGVMELGVGAIGRSPARVVSIAAGLGSEVTAFELTNRTLQTVGANLVFAPNEGRSQGSPLQHPSPVTHHLSPNLWNWSGTGGWREGLTSSAITFGMLKGIGFLARGENIIFQHTLQSTAMVGGHQVSGHLGLTPRPEGTLAEQFLYAEVTNLQMGAGIGLVHSFAPRIQALESGLDFSMRTMDVGALLAAPFSSEAPLQNPFDPFSLQPSLAKPTSLFRSKKTPSLPENIHLMSSLKDEGSGKKATDLTERYRPLFPQEAPHTFTEKIISDALETKLKDPLLTERLLEAYSQSPNRGSGEQFYTAGALKALFEHDAIRTPTGSFDSTLFQTLLTHVLAEESVSKRERRMQTVFQTMEKNQISRFTLEKFFKEWNYDTPYRSSLFPRFSFASWRLHLSTGRETLRGYHWMDKMRILNFLSSLSGNDPEKIERWSKVFGEARRSTRYSPELIDQVLDSARRHPVGNLILKRMLQVFAVEDAPVKLKELVPSGDEKNSLQWIKEMGGEGKSLEEIAQAINGTRHNAYFEDLRLARKIAKLVLEIQPDLEGKSSERDAAQKNLYRALRQFVDRGKPLTTPQLIALAGTNPGPHLKEFKKLWSEKKFDFEVIPAEVFDWMVKAYSHISGAQESIFIPAISPKQRSFLLSKKMPPPEKKELRRAFEQLLNRLSERDQILIRQMAPGIPTSAEGWEETYGQLRFRLWGVHHEFGHFLHHSGLDEAILPGEAPLLIRNMSRQDRLISEIWAFLQEQPWRVQNMDVGSWIIAGRLGENFPLYIRNLNDQWYFEATNERLMRELFPPP